MTRPVAVAYAPLYRMPLGPHVFPSDKYERTWKRCREARSPRQGRRTSRPKGRSPTTSSAASTRRSTSRGCTRLAEEDPEAGLLEFEVPCFPGVVSAQATMARGTLMVTRWVLEHGRRGLRASTSAADSTTRSRTPGQGFCLFNDIALSIVDALDRKRDQAASRRRLDVHQGNGTIHIFRNDPRVFTLDLHQANNYPIKQPASMNVGLPDDCGDDEYVAALESALADAIARHEPDFVHYVAGGDPFEGDQLGGLALTKEGLRRRDRRSSAPARERTLPLVATLAGGYATRHRGSRRDPREPRRRDGRTPHDPEVL